MRNQDRSFTAISYALRLHYKQQFIYHSLLTHCVRSLKWTLSTILDAVIHLILKSDEIFLNFFLPPFTVQGFPQIISDLFGRLIHFDLLTWRLLIRCHFKASEFPNEDLMSFSLYGKMRNKTGAEIWESWLECSFFFKMDNVYMYPVVCGGYKCRQQIYQEFNVLRKFKHFSCSF